MRYMIIYFIEYLLMKKIIIFLCILTCIVLSGCQLPLSNTMRDEVFPKEAGTKLALSPILLPTYAVCCVLDVFIINPIRGCANIPSTCSSIWSWKNESPALGYGALLPVKLIAIPPAAIGTMMFSEQFSTRENLK